MRIGGLCSHGSRMVSSRRKERVRVGGLDVKPGYDEYEAGKKPSSFLSSEQWGASIETLLGSCSSRNEGNGDSASRATSFNLPKEHHSQDSSSSTALGHAMGRYLNQALEEEPWSPVMTRD